MYEGLLNDYYDRHVITVLREDMSWANQGKDGRGSSLTLGTGLCLRQNERTEKCNILTYNFSFSERGGGTELRKYELLGIFMILIS
jgi:hypothetical protein